MFEQEIDTEGLLASEINESPKMSSLDTAGEIKVPSFFFFKACRITKNHEARIPVTCFDAGKKASVQESVK